MFQQQQDSAKPLWIETLRTLPGIQLPPGTFEEAVVAICAMVKLRGMNVWYGRPSMKSLQWYTDSESVWIGDHPPKIPPLWRIWALQKKGSLQSIVLSGAATSPVLLSPATCLGHHPLLAEYGRIKVWGPLPSSPSTLMFGVLLCHCLLHINQKHV